MQGSLESTNIAELLRDLIRARKSGLLFLQNGEIGKGLYLAAGEIVNAESNAREDGLGYRLLDEGKLTPVVLQAALPRVEPGLTLAEILVQDGTLTGDDLQPLMRALAEQVVLSVFDWTRGTYLYQEGDFDHKGRFALNTPALVLEGVRRMFQFDPIRVRLLEEPRPLVALAEPSLLNLEPTEGFLLSRVDGHGTVAEICSLSIISEEMTCRILYGLLAAGLIGYADGAAAAPGPLRSGGATAARTSAGSASSTGSSTPLPKPERVRPPAAGSSGPRVERLAPDEARRASAPRIEPFQPEADAPRQSRAPTVERLQPTGPDDDLTPGRRRELTLEVQRLFDTLGELSPHELLGVSKSAPRSAIEQAFQERSARFHPARNSWVDDEALRSQLVFVFAKLKLAYQTLTGGSPPSTGAVIDETASNVSIQFTRTERQRERDKRLRDSQNLYNEAAGQFEAKRYHEARENLQRAIRLNEEDARFHALLARVDMLNPNMRWQKEAENHWRRAIELDRWNAEYRVGLALLYKHAGMERKAQKEFIEVLRLDSLNAIALQEIPPELRPEPERFEDRDKESGTDDEGETPPEP